MCFLSRAFSSNFGKGPSQNWEKMVNLTSKLGEINDIEHNKDSKIYPQICIMPRLPLSTGFKYHSDMGYCFLNWEKTDMVFGKKVAIFDSEWGGYLAPREGQKMPCSGKKYFWAEYTAEYTSSALSPTYPLLARNNNYYFFSGSAVAQW